MNAHMLLIMFFVGLLLASEHFTLAQSQCTELEIEWEPPEIRCIVADGLPGNPGCNTEFYFNGSKEAFRDRFGGPHESSLDISVTRESEGVFSCGLGDSSVESEERIILCKLIIFQGIIIGLHVCPYTIVVLFRPMKWTESRGLCAQAM